MPLSQNATFQQEIHRWSTFCQDLKHKPSSLSDAFIFAHPDYYPNIREIFHILLTIPIGSLPCERSFSALSRLKQWNRPTMVSVNNIYWLNCISYNNSTYIGDQKTSGAAMVEDRLNGLALLYIHRDVNVDRIKILDKFDTGNRRIGALHLQVTLLTFIVLCTDINISNMVLKFD